MGRLLLRTLALATAAAFVTSCSGPTPGGPAMDPRTALAARPDSAEAIARYEQMQQRIRDQLDRELGPFDWKRVRDGDTSTCGGVFRGLGGVVVYLPPWGFDGNLTDSQWPRARQIITAVTAEYGFTTPTLQIDLPGRHTTTSADTALGAQYEFGTEVNTSMQVTTGCHRPAG